LAAICGKDVNISELIKRNPASFLGKDYSDKYLEAGTNLAFLFKVLSVN
jgi:mannose-6-phosphate isomerase class I